MLSCVADGDLEGYEALGALMGILQAVVYWACSVWMLFIVMTYPSSEPFPAYGAESKSLANAKGIIVIWIAYTLFSLVPAIAIALPRPWEPSMGPDIFMFINGNVNTVVSIMCVIAGSIAQVLASGSLKSLPGSLSLWTLTIQVPVLILHGGSWLPRFKGYGSENYFLGWPLMSYHAAGIGQLFVLVVCLVYGPRNSTGIGFVNEQTSLLRS